MKRTCVFLALSLITGWLAIGTCLAAEAENKTGDVNVRFELTTDTAPQPGSLGPASFFSQHGGKTLELKRIGSPKVSEDLRVLAKTESRPLLFDGQSQYRVAESIFPLLRNFTLEVYAKADRATHQGLHAVVAHGNGAGGYLIAQQGDEWVCFVGSRGAARFGKVKAGQWERLRITYENDVLSLYRNGKQVLPADGNMQLPIFYGGKQRATSDVSSVVRKNFSIGGVDGHHRESFVGQIAAVTFSGKQAVQAAYINTWMVSGPYAVGTVKSVAEAKDWRYFDDRLFSRNCDDYQDLRSWVTLFRKKKAASVEVWSKTHVYSAKAIPAQLRLGADHQCDAWVNGEKVGQTVTCHPDRDSIKWGMTLKKGWNELVLRVGNRKNGRLGFYARITDLRGAAIDGLIISPEGGEGRLRISSQALTKGSTDILPVAWREWCYVGMEPLDTISPKHFPVLSRRAHSSPFMLTAAGGSASYTWRVAKGTLPQGLELSADGSITGTVPADAALKAYTFSVSVTDATGAAVEKEMSVTLRERPNKRVEEQRLIALIHRPEHTPVNGFDDFAALMKRQGYKMGIPIGYNNGAHTYRWPNKAGFRPLNPRNPRAAPIGDVITPYKKALEKHGLDFGVYMGNFNGRNHDGPDGMVRIFEEIMDTFQPKLIWFDWAGWQGTSLDAAFSAVRARDPECVILVNQASHQRYGNGDWDLICMEAWTGWGSKTWHFWPYAFDWPKKHAMEAWRLLPEPRFSETPRIKADWREILRVQISIICEGYIANIDHSTTLARKHTIISHRLKSWDDSEQIKYHRNMAAWASPKDLPPLHTAYTNCNPGPIQNVKWGYSTVSVDGRFIYLHVMKTPRGKTGMPADGTLRLKSLAGALRSAACMNTGGQVPWSVEGDDVIIDASRIEADPVDTIFVLETRSDGNSKTMKP